MVDVATFAVVTPVCDPLPSELAELWGSIRAQDHRSWEWCIADDASTDPDVVSLLTEIARDPRVRLIRRPERGGIVAATNAAAAQAEARYLAFVDHDDLLHRAALADVAGAIDVAETAGRPSPDVLYTDEDVLDADGTRVAPFYKPAWSPERQRAQHYVGHLTVIRREVFEAVGGLDPEAEGSQDLDVMLRISEQTDRIVKVPGVLYHWRATARSVAGDAQAKPYAYEAAMRSIAAHVERSGIAATVRHLIPNGRYAVVRTPPAPIPITFVVTDGDGPRRTGAGSVPTDPQTAADLLGAELVVVDPDEAVGAAARNLGAARAAGDVLVFVERSGRWTDDLEAWQHLAAVASEPGVGAVGPANHLDDGSVLDAGVVVGPEGLVPLLADVPLDADVNRGELAVAREVSALSGWSLAIRRDRFVALGGFNPDLDLHRSAADLCLKARLTGLRVVWTPMPAVEFPASARWSVTSPVALDGAFGERWRPWLGSDPYYTSDVRLGRAHYIASLNYPE